jgi:hypothetical protein
MRTKMLFAAALIASLSSIAVAQDGRFPEASLDRELNFQVPAGAAITGNQPHQAPTPPKYCKPCLFYAGDYDTLAGDPNGMSNEVDFTVSTGAAMYTPFIVPKGQIWTITGLFTNNFMYYPVLDPAISPYEIREGIPKAGGHGGKLVCHGRKPATVTFAVSEENINIWATKVEHIKGCRLTPGKYWLSVVPYCTNQHDSNCTNDYRAFLSNDDGAMAHRFGPLEPANDSFFNSVYFGANWDPSSKWQTSSRFSVGVEGTSTGR